MLNELINSYVQHKYSFDELKKICDAENKEIKKAMKEAGVNKYTVGGYVAKYQVQKRETMNEEMLLDMFRVLNSRDLTLGIIKTKEYIDYSALESAIYNGKIPSEMIADMDKAREVTEVEVLRITRAKEED